MRTEPKPGMELMIDPSGSFGFAFEPEFELAGLTSTRLAPMLVVFNCVMIMSIGGISGAMVVVRSLTCIQYISLALFVFVPEASKTTIKANTTMESMAGHAAAQRIAILGSF